MTEDDPILTRADRADFLAQQANTVSMNYAHLPMMQASELELEKQKDGTFILSVHPASHRLQVGLLSCATVPTPYGLLFCAFHDENLVYTGFQYQGAWEKTYRQVRHLFPKADILTDGTYAQKMQAYFQGNTVLRGAAFGTIFQNAVWQALCTIPAGRVTTYQEIARVIDRPKAMRAVGSAVGANPISLFVPCHRVIHGNAKTQNYGWGVARKTLILGLEQGIDLSMDQGALTEKTAFLRAVC